MINTPYELSGTATTPAEETAFLSALVADSGRVSTYNLGQSQDGRNLIICGVGGTSPPTLPEEPNEDPASLLIVGAQHGSWEPASRDGALVYLRDAAYETSQTRRDAFDANPLWIIPNWNPDGTAKPGTGYESQSWFTNGVNPNRDLIELSSPETRAWVDAIRRVNPATIINLHENNSFATYLIEIQTELFLGETNAGLSAGIGQQMFTSITGTLTAEGFNNGLFDAASDYYQEMLNSYGQLTAVNHLLVETKSSSSISITARVPRQVRTVELAADWHYENHAAIVAAVTETRADIAARVGQGQTEWNYAEDLTVTAVGYTLTPEQVETHGHIIYLNRLAHYVTQEGDTFIPLAQPFAPLIVATFDANAPDRATSATREIAAPQPDRRRASVVGLV